ncbi:MAG TPA: GNAT family N-acetyltransferase [Sphingomicrobium sp.]|nr:GNAT family N-acetyltransferase [Sphingomicrobium sp.]
MVLIRLAEQDDAAAIAEVYRPYVENSRVSFEEQAPDAAAMARRIAGDRPGFHPWLIAEDDGRALGFASSSPFRSRRAYRWSVEIGIYLAPDAAGRGLGRKLLGTLVDLLERQGYVAAIGAIALPNEPSVRLHQALGFVHAGTYRGTGFKMGQWMDVDLWQKDLAPRSASPAEPLPFEPLFQAPPEA